MLNVARLAVILIGLFAPAVCVAQAPSVVAPDAITQPAQKRIGIPQARKQSEALIVLNAHGARLAGSSLTLDGVAQSAVLFASRPTRSAGHLPTGELVELWTSGSFAKDPPNATVSAFAKDGSKVSDAVVVLRHPRLSGEQLTFDVAVLEGSLGNADGPASIFIDTIWFGVGSGGFSYLGRSQTTGGTDPAIGSAHDTSTFSGWSNPAPSAPPPPPSRPLPCGTLPYPPCN